MKVDGRIRYVSWDDLGTNLVEPADAGQTDLIVQSVSDLDDEGAAILIAGNEHFYVIVEEQEGYDVIRVDPPLPAAVEVGEEVTNSPAVTVMIAKVSQTDEDELDEGEPLEVDEDELADELIDVFVGPEFSSTLETGPREGNTGEYVQIDDESGDWDLVKIYGRPGYVNAEVLIGTIPDIVLAGTQFDLDLQEAISNIESIDAELATGLGIKVYRQDDAPTGDIRSNSIWFDTNDGNKMYTWNAGTSTWVSAQDQVAIDAKQLAQEANANILLLPDVYRQSTEPADKTAGSIWFNTANGNRIYTANGTTYTLAQQTAIVGSQLVGTAIDGFTITGSIFQTSANAGNGSTAGVRFGSTGIYAYNNASTTPTVSVTASTGILQAVGAIITGQINATSGSITGILDMSGSGVIRTAASGQRVQISTAGIATYGTSGSTPTAVLSSASGGLNLTGLLNVASTGQISVGNTDNFVRLSTSTVGGSDVDGGLAARGSILFGGTAYERPGEIYVDSGGVGSLFLNSPAATGAGNRTFLRIEAASGLPGTLRTNAGTVNFSQSVTFTAGSPGNPRALWLSSYGNIRLIPDGDLQLETAGGYVTSNQIYDFTASATANLAINGTTKRIHRTSSSLQYKDDVKPLVIDPDAIDGLVAYTWLDKGEIERYFAMGGDEPEPIRYPGFIAEYLHAAGLGQFVIYNELGKPESIYYDRLIAVLVPAIQDLRKRMEEKDARDKQKDAIMEEFKRQLASQDDIIGQLKEAVGI